MDYVDILKRAFQITFRYRALWIFGFFLALCSGGGGGGGGQNYSIGSDDFGNGGPGAFLGPNPGLVIAIISIFVCLVLLLIVIGVIVRAVTRAALIGMVDRAEEGQAVTIKNGWSIGWSRHAWTLFLINLIIGIPAFILTVIALLAALSPFLISIFNPNETNLFILGIVAGVSLLLLFIVAAIVFTVVISAFLELSWRYAVLRNLGALDSLQASYTLIRRNLKHVTLTVLLLLGIGLGWFIVSLILTVGLTFLGLLIGGIPALLLFWLTEQIWVAILVGLPLFLVTFILPLIFITGLYLVFRSSIWTLVFRALMAANQPRALLAEKSVDPRGEPISTQGEDTDRCQAITKSGRQCKNRALPGSAYCYVHQE